MHTVMQAIFRAKKNFGKEPFFAFLQDDSRSVRDRLEFYPCMAHFILAFGDLNKYVLRDNLSLDPHQQMVNAHTYEDDHHWPWYLEDLANLGFDHLQSMGDALRFLFRDDTRVSRMLSARLAHLIYGATPIERLVIIEAIEETGNVMFTHTAALAREIEAASGLTLRYLGDFHLALETGHAMGDADHAALLAIELDAAARARCLALSDEVFALFRALIAELHAFALAALELRRASPGSTISQSVQPRRM
jgi:hypothetical protein